MRPGNSKAWIWGRLRCIGRVLEVGMSRPVDVPTGEIPDNFLGLVAFGAQFTGRCRVEHCHHLDAERLSLFFERMPPTIVHGDGIPDRGAAQNPSGGWTGTKSDPGQASFD